MRMSFVKISIRSTPFTFFIHILNMYWIAFLAISFTGLAHPDVQRSREPQSEIHTDPCDDIPSLNNQIVTYVRDHLNRKVGRGECWDLAADVLNTYHATWNGRYEFGDRVDYKNECVYPGDIIQFENVIVESHSGNSYLTESMSHHTAIIYAVSAPGQFTLAHQNYGKGPKKVGLTPLNIENITRGRITIYRPRN